jgi:hypothetical protein
MVCIIDDREDVWNYARNLICVQPYFYFKNTGDINDPHKPGSSKHTKKRKMLENLTAYKQQQSAQPLVAEAVTAEAAKSKQRPDEDLNVEENLANILTDSKSNELAIDNNSVDSTLSTSSNGSASDLLAEGGKKKVNQLICFNFNVGRIKYLYH